MHQAKSMFDQLVALQRPIPDGVFVNGTLEGLRSEFCPFVQVIEACSAPLLIYFLFYSAKRRILLLHQCKLRSQALVSMDNVPL